MKILYVETETKLKKDIEWTWYVDNETIIDKWNKYKERCEQLILVAPYEKEICMKGQRDLTKIGNRYVFEDKGIILKETDDIYNPKIKSNIKMRKQIKFNIEITIRDPDIDLVIIGSKDNFYKRSAIEVCEKFHKKYIIENKDIKDIIYN